MKSISEILLYLLIGSSLAAIQSDMSCAATSDVQCLRCHGRRELAKVKTDGQVVSLYVDQKACLNSVHAGINCVSCHTDLADMEQTPHPADLKPVNCTTCHESESRDYIKSTHGQLVMSGRSGAPTCATCHGKHDILSPSNPQSPTYRTNSARICLHCHADQEIIPGSGEKVKAYEQSVHGRRALAQGDTAVAECVDCHGNHKVLPADNPTSPVYKPHIPETCGKCHPATRNEYEKSIHGQAIRQGIYDAPVCTDCHGEHTIEAPEVEGSKVSPANIPRTCGSCHEDVQLTEKYGIASERFTTYEDSYHGVANKYGKTLVANCASCHGYHDILPSSDPASTINPTNLAKTCGNCHPNAGENFTKGKMHVKATLENSPGVFFVRRFYYLFIGGLMVLFIVYIVVEYSGFLRRKRRKIDR